MITIENFDQARKCVESVQESVAGLRRFLEVTEGNLKRFLNGPGERSSSAVPLVTSQPQPSEAAPENWTERVKMIFKKAARPLRQKQAVQLYQELGWPQADSREQLYQSISGAIAYLHKKDYLLKDNDGAYLINGSKEP